MWHAVRHRQCTTKKPITRRLFERGVDRPTRHRSVNNDRLEGVGKGQSLRFRFTDRSEPATPLPEWIRAGVCCRGRGAIAPGIRVAITVKLAPTKGELRVGGPTRSRSPLGSPVGDHRLRPHDQVSFECGFGRSAIRQPRRTPTVSPRQEAVLLGKSSCTVGRLHPRWPRLASTRHHERHSGAVAPPFHSTALRWRWSEGWGGGRGAHRHWVSTDEMLRHLIVYSNAVHRQTRVSKVVLPAPWLSCCSLRALVKGILGTPVLVGRPANVCLDEPDRDLRRELGVQIPSKELCVLESDTDA